MRRDECAVAGPFGANAGGAPGRLGWSLVLISFVGASLALDDRPIAVILVIVVLILAIGMLRRPSMRCPRCQQVNREQAVFCAQCGQRLPGR
ncbi:MAG: zinc ribbon domain-containing protein [Planctomycetota bacterium]|mgnify:FL=1